MGILNYIRNKLFGGTVNKFINNVSARYGANREELLEMWNDEHMRFNPEWNRIKIVGSKPGKPKQRKTRIPASLKKLVWNTYIGESVGSSKCLCCNYSMIQQIDFHCGHVVPEAKGGPTTVENLRPICAQCNLCMGTNNLEEFKRKYFN